MKSINRKQSKHCFHYQFYLDLVHSLCVLQCMKWLIGFTAMTGWFSVTRALSWSFLWGTHQGGFLTSCMLSALPCASPAEQLVFSPPSRANAAGSHPAEQEGHCGDLARQRGQHSTEIQACMNTHYLLLVLCSSCLSVFCKTQLLFVFAQKVSVAWWGRR